MSGWSMLICGSVGFTGAVCFLRLVANAVADAQSVMQLLEEREQRLYRQRLDVGKSAAPAVVDVAREGQTDM